MIISEENINNLDIAELSVVPTKTLIRKLGKPEDCVELAIYDLNGKLIQLDEDFRGYTIGEDVDSNGLYNEIKLDYKEILNFYNFASGKYNVVLNFYRKAILNSPIKPFFISEISPSRREIKIKSNLLPNNQITTGFEQLIGVIDLSGYFREYVLNFGDTITATAVNFIIDNISDPTEVLIKLFEPLPTNIGIGSEFSLAEEIINPTSVIVDLGTFDILNNITGEELKGPNFRVDTRLNSSKSSIFRTYDDILGGSVSSSFSNIDNYISGGLELAIDFTDTDTDTGYNFENFIHFGSAVEKLKNFRYKLQLLEGYNKEIAEIDTLEGDQTSSAFVITEREDIEKKKKNMLNTFDAYERFLYYESGTYSWPKIDSTKPYINTHTTSSDARTWIGSEDSNNVYYGGQLLSGSEYDGLNIHRLTNTLPEHILSNPDNAQYELFVNMVAEHFDKIWIYIDHITNINQSDNKLDRGVSKDLVYDVLEKSGVKVFDQFENENLFSYITADYAADGTFQYQAPVSQSMVSASNAGSIPKGDITKEVWKRVNHNLPYLLQTKGTERGLKALISCYGIPESILHIKEYGGPTVDKTGFRSFSYQKASKMVNSVGKPDSPGAGADAILRIIPGSFDSDSTFIFKNNSDVIKSVQIRYLPNVIGTDITEKQDIFGFCPTSFTAKDVALIVSSSIQNDQENGDQYGKLVIVTGSAQAGLSDAFKAESNPVPLFNGKPWNITITIDSGSSNDINAYATQTTFNKNTYVASASIASADEALSNDWTGSNLYVNPLNSNFAFAEADTAANRSSSFQEFRVWTTVLNKDTVVTQSLSPFNYNGNTISSSYDELVFRLPLGSDFQEISGASSNLITPNNHSPNPNAIVEDVFNNDRIRVTVGEYIDIEETHHLTTPDTVGKSTVSDKVRIDTTGIIDNDILSPVVKSEEAISDRQPNDFSDLGVFFSPTFEVNEDIIYTLGGFRLDDYIGDPRHYTSSNYPDLEDIKAIYTQKITGRLSNMWDYLKLIQQFDHTVFKMIEQFAPAKANLKTGLVIEPHYLERPKLNGTHLTTDSSYNEFDFNINDVNPTVTSEYELYNVDFGVYNTLTEGSRGGVENNAIYGSRSKTFYTRIRPFAQSITTDSVITDPNDDGGPVAPPTRDGST